ncbi:MAG: twin-arginine translocase TatA/TatE family subunit, partial [Deltaproteobacteria bacterium]|nr:twin-arginine translocase TatA/TatE family subunit [Deltaproteobacteria bacterium]
GPNKLPDLAKSLGKGLAEFKKASEDFQKNVQEEARKSDEDKKEPVPPQVKTAHAEEASNLTKPEQQPSEKSNTTHA